MATYTKLRDGSWGVRVQGAAKSGESVTVTKKSGESRVETISKVLWTDGKVSLCSIAQSSGYTARRGFSGSRSSGGCCDNCGSGRGRYRRTDSSGIVGMVCGTCNHESQYELSFA